MPAVFTVDVWCICQLRFWGSGEPLEAVTFVRDDFPGAQLRFVMMKKTGPQMVMDGSTTYTVHFHGTIPEMLRFTVPGLDQYV